MLRHYPVVCNYFDAFVFAEFLFRFLNTFQHLVFFFFLTAKNSQCLCPLSPPLQSEFLHMVQLKSVSLVPGGKLCGLDI